MRLGGSNNSLFLNSARHRSKRCKAARASSSRSTAGEWKTDGGMQGEADSVAAEFHQEERLAAEVAGGLRD